MGDHPRCKLRGQPVWLFYISDTVDVLNATDSSNTISIKLRIFIFETGNKNYIKLLST